MIKCAECGLSGDDYGLRAMDGRLWTMDEMEEKDENHNDGGDWMFNVFSEEAYDKMDWIKITYSQRDGKTYCIRCEQKLFADEMRIEQIIARRKAHEERTGQLQMFPSTEVE